MPPTEDTPADIFKRATAIALKAMSGLAEIEVAFTTDAESAAAAAVQTLPAPRIKLPLPALNLPAHDKALTRGAADAAALRLRYHNETLHKAKAPQAATARAAFDALEQARCEALGGRRMRGVAANITALLDQKCTRSALFAASGKHEIPLEIALRLLAHEALSGQPVPASGAAAVALWRPYIENKIGPHLGNLPHLINDQKAFATEANRILNSLDLAFPGDNSSDEKNSQSEPETPDTPQDEQEQTEQSGTGETEDEDETQPQPQSGEASQEEDQTNAENTFTEGQSTENESEDGRNWRPEDENTANGPLNTYRVFTTDYDEIIAAETLCGPEERDRLHRLLMRQVSAVQSVIVRLANKLQRFLMAQQTRSWEFDLEEGLLDSARLSRVIINPAHSLSYKFEKEIDFKDTAVTFLLDNSGSMRGRPITLAAISADVLARTLERCGVKVEILGFTTRTWKGGQSREAWLKSGKPALPGRLNDIRYVIYKAADAPWRRARKNLGLMLREGLLKENIDGEALLWAHQRLLARREQRRILMVISDGAPVDDSTLSVNASNYLEQHLCSVINWIEKTSPIELTAIGIGHDVTRYYKRAVTITDAEQLGGTMMEQLAALFAPASGKRP